MTTIAINPHDPASIQAALNTEWLLTNGLGGYAMGTALGVNTRRYHGLLVAATKPPVGRIVALHSMIEQLVIPKDDGTEEVIDLSTQQFGTEMMLNPPGWRHLRQFEVKKDSVTWTLDTGDVQVLRTIQVMPHRQQLTVSYNVQSKHNNWRLRSRPLLMSRDFHALNQHYRSDTAAGASTVKVDYILSLDISHTATRWVNDSQTWNNFAYVRDRDRGQDWIENDVWSPYFWEFDAHSSPGMSIAFTAILVWSKTPRPSPRTKNTDLSSDPNLERLKAAASQFVVERWHGKDSLTSVIAGYPWFGDWGRDTMIALQGLMLCTGRFDEARSTLLTFARSMKNGLIPNLFDDYGGADHYNTVDASLWFVHAAHGLWKATSKTDAELLKACREIIAAYRQGTDFNIRMDPRDGLIAAGDPSTQLTWMDAKRDNIAFTPRNGKPVEINALWFNALRCLAEMTEDSREREELIALSEKVAKSFREQYWWSARDCLHDVLTPREDASVDLTFASDHRLRPNQIFAVSLPFSPLTKEQQRAVVDIIRERLLTSFGLRTLDRDDPQYRGRYEGNLFDRDSAYHQGTVWPWLIGPYCEALLRVNDFSADAKGQVKQIIQPLIDEMSNTTGGRCINQIAEVYDGDLPHRPSGCPAQAWSVAEVLRIVSLIENDSSTV
jgi:glycogen debranching enzyme